ncbi:MAG: sulfotransferase [Pseudomonadota bacterium]|nr:sulfotransferase [Pseudomonadota bacterium]
MVQALIARHPDVYTLPETGFFEALYGGTQARWGDPYARDGRRWYHRRLHLAQSRGRRRLRELEHGAGLSRRPPAPWRDGACVRRFVHMLDRAATRAECSAWIEKTPQHLLYLDEIAAAVPDARFVHVIRQGEDVLASIMDASMRYAEKGIFSGGTARWSLRWNRAASIHREHALRPHHHFVFLEDLIHDTPAEWRRLCGFLGFDPNAELTGNADGLITDVREEPWKNEAVSGQPSKPRRKAESMFGPQVLEWLQRTLMPYDELRRNCARGG